ncbi:glycosyltransferase [Urechidicola vernalis]|uniref:Glycosyltransferase n=1 Tax=Urechidicola vernalis TaxID=3075600 RepID=A0ABU2Y4Q9_9FLAO|nr:glycosyltransferase [Urechidicola sp. P050]MDT0552265.1 glycosyltransferase [Urechidicola sp. P050]
MAKKLKIAIYSGNIPSTTFIEQLISSVSQHHQVLLFGRKTKKYQVPKNKLQKTNSKSVFSKGKHSGEVNETLEKERESVIREYAYGTSTFQNILLTSIRTLLLAIRFPKRLKTLFTQIRKQGSIYKKRQAWFKITPILLYLPDIFHIQWAKETEQWLFLQALGVKVVVSLRGAHINYSPIANKTLANSYERIFPKVDAFHAVSEAIAKEVQKYVIGQEKIHVIHSLLPENTFDLFTLPKEKDSKHINILSVGRHHWKKGFTTALDACKLLKDEGVSFTYTIIAGGIVLEELLVQRHELGLLKEVQFKISLPQQEVFQSMKNSDVLLLPSYEEGIANVVLEAMAMGLPVISTDCGGMEEVVISLETGWIVPTLDSEEIAKSLRSYLNVSDKIKRVMISNARKLVLEKFDAVKNGALFLEMYHHIMQSRK